MELVWLDFRYRIGAIHFEIAIYGWVNATKSGVSLSYICVSYRITLQQIVRFNS